MSRCLGLFSYYSQWIPRFSDRIKPIASCKSFPPPPPAVEAFESLKKTIEDAVVTAIDETFSSEVETDASEVALAATLNQNGRPVLTNPSRQWAEACIHREGSPGHNRSGETLEILPYWKTLHPENWPEISVLHVWQALHREDKEREVLTSETWTLLLQFWYHLSPW